MSGPAEREAIMADYRAAYVRANGHDPNIRYAGGWYSIGRPPAKFREARVREMIATLLSRRPL